jgi:Kef-type K+ transport system membrane component KefB
MVMRETNSEGPLTETLTGIIAINNVVCLIAFSIVAAGIEMQAVSSVGPLESAYLVLYPLVWQIVGAIALGFLIGWMLASWGSQVVEHGETLILLAGSILLTVGLANILDVSPLVASLSLGATMVNLSSRSRALFTVLSRTDPPLYAIFFVIAGADLNLGLLPSLGLLGVIYAVGRAAGKLIGANYAARITGLDPQVQKLLGVAMLSQAGLAIGLVLIVGERFPQISATVTTVVLAAVAVFELIGPVGAKIALVRSGETCAAATEEAPVI